MGCFLQLSIWDKETNLPLDMGLNFMASTSSWPSYIAIFEKKTGISLKYHESEFNHDSVDGVRCWWTDSVAELMAFIEYVERDIGWGIEDTRIKVTAFRWHGTDKYRFIMELT